MGHPIQYAQLPAYEYPSFEIHYQTFDRHSLKTSYYPVTSLDSDPLTPEKNQDNNPPAAEEASPPADNPEESSTSSPADTSSSPDAEGMFPSCFVLLP